ncbi:hypothetical protein KAS50_07425, partial [bacterium]|nr:hypothetical protein [bacterium]
YGDDYILNLVRSTRKGVEGINDALRGVNAGKDFEDILLDWALANYINDRDVDGKYGYEKEQTNIKAFLHNDHFSYPVQEDNRVLKPYGYEYIQFSSGDSLKAAFTGSNIIIKAIKYGADFVSIEDVQPGSEFREDSFGDSVYKVVFAVINSSFLESSYSYSGTAIQSLLVQELAYDDGTPDPFSGEAYFLGFGLISPGYGWAVRFTPPSPTIKLLNARMFVYASTDVPFEFHIWDDSDGEPGDDMITPIFITPPALGQQTWVTVDLSEYQDQLTNFTGDFYIGIIQPLFSSIFIGMDNSQPDERSTYSYFGPSSTTTGWYTLDDLAVYEVMEGDTTKQGLEGFNMMMRVKMSVDVREIEPIAPRNLSAAAGESEVILEWLPNNEWDVSYYNVYRNTDESFVPSESDLLGTTD